MPPNLADPNVEPTDEELQGLARDAFAGVAAENEASRERMRARIREARVTKRASKSR